jgi:hypothetical protein
MAAPLERLFGVEHLVATEAATAPCPHGETFTGEIEGEPRLRQQEVMRMARRLALAVEPARSLQALAQG